MYIPPCGQYRKYILAGLASIPLDGAAWTRKRLPGASRGPSKKPFAAVDPELLRNQPTTLSGTAAGWPSKRTTAPMPGVQLVDERGARSRSGWPNRYGGKNSLSYRFALRCRGADRVAGKRTSISLLSRISITNFSWRDFAMSNTQRSCVFRRSVPERVVVTENHAYRDNLHKHPAQFAWTWPLHARIFSYS